MAHIINSYNNKKGNNIIFSYNNMKRYVVTSMNKFGIKEIVYPSRNTAFKEYSKEQRILQRIGF